EAQAPIDYDWLSRPFGGMFTQAERPGPDGLVRYRGDAIRVLTTQNQWLRHAYECAWDPRARKVVSVQLRPGRLVPPADVAAFIKSVLARSQAQQVAKGVQPQLAQQGVSKPAVKPRPHFGEPSQISITQA